MSEPPTASAPPSPTGPTAPPKASALWDKGWYQPAQHLASPNFGPRPAGATVDLLVVHSISLPPGQYGGPQVLDFFCNCLDWTANTYFDSIRGLRVSSHFFITRAGVVWQLVSCDARAWHAGQSHYRGRDDCNDDSIGVELEGLEGLTFEPEQYAALAQLAQAIATQYPLCYVAGHEHIAPGRKRDPGPGFEWARFAKESGLPRQCFP